jgi:hypothetical protein
MSNWEKKRRKEVLAWQAYEERKNHWVIYAVIFVIVLVAAMLWIVWPYYAVYDFAIAFRKGDISVLENRVAWDSVRQGLRDDLNAALLRHLSTDAKTDEPGAALGTSLAVVLGPAIVDRMIDSYVTPQGIAAAVNRASSTNVENGGPPKDFTEVVQSWRQVGWDRVQYAFFSGGPLTFRIEIPAEHGQNLALIFKWSSNWKLTRVILPIPN